MHLSELKQTGRGKYLLVTPVLAVVLVKDHLVVDNRHDLSADHALRGVTSSMLLPAYWPIRGKKRWTSAMYRTRSSTTSAGSCPSFFLFEGEGKKRFYFRVSVEPWTCYG